MNLTIRKNSQCITCAGCNMLKNTTFTGKYTCANYVQCVPYCTDKLILEELRDSQYVVSDVVENVNHNTIVYFKYNGINYGKLGNNHLEYFKGDTVVQEIYLCFGSYK